MISDLQIPDPAVLPTKTDLQELSDVVTGFRDKVAAEAKETARAFEARKEEHGSLASKIDDAKGILEAVRTELREGHATAGKGVETLQVLLQGLTTAAEGFATRTTITDMTESLQKDLAKLATAQEEAKEQLDRTGSAQARKVDETRERLTTDLVASFDARFNDVGTRLDEERTYLENKFELSRTRDINQLEALSGTKAAMENLVGVIREEAHEFYEKSQRSFASLSSGLEAQATLIGTESGKTTAEVKQLEEQLGEMQPAIITAVQSVLEAVGQLSKTSDQSQEALLSNLRQLPTLVAEAMPKVEVPPAYDDTPVRGKLDTLIKHVRTHPPPDPYDDSLVMGKLDTVVSYVKTASSRGGGDSTEVQEKLDEIVEMIEQLPEPQVYDDAPVQEKLDTLIDQSTVTGELLLQMDKLDAIQAQVKATQQEMVEAMAAQKAWFATEQTSRRKEAEEAAILLEKRRSQKEKVEQEILALHDEKDTLLESVRTLRNEKEELTRATGKLARELSSLETALRIRKEEMRVMEERAEALEKRVIEGVLDHTRGLLVERGISTSTADLEGASAGQMRRVKRDSGHGSIKSDAVNSSVAMALKRRGPPRTRTVTGAAKRILSLNNASINANRPMDRRVSVITPSGAGGSHGSAFPNLKRSHSVKQGLGAGRNFSLDSGRGALEGQGQQSAVALASGLDLSIPLSEEQEHDHEQEHEYDEGRDTPSSKYETPYETPHRVETPANHDGAAGDDTASAEATPVQPRDGAAAATVYGKGGRRGADTRSTISSLDRPSFDSSTDLTTPASIQDGFAADGQRCFSGGDGDAIESTYDESFAHSPHRDDRNHSMAEVTGYTQGTYDEGTEYGDDDDNDNDGDGDGDGDVDGKRAA
ncbi:hypothetical protein KEM52_006481 [Ascosphaera acerosa]|nr:hypothetical protein KEM52_006481 [Ascosphaera acerosa]